MAIEIKVNQTQSIKEAAIQMFQETRERGSDIITTYRGIQLLVAYMTPIDNIVEAWEMEYKIRQQAKDNCEEANQLDIIARSLRNKASQAVATKLTTVRGS